MKKLKLIFVIKDLTLQEDFQSLLLVESEPFDEIYQFAADMGGAGYIFTGDNDANLMHNSISINLNILMFQNKINLEKNLNKTTIFYSSACIYRIQSTRSR